MLEIKVSDEYLDTVCDWLEEWIQDPNSLIIPQFLRKYGIGWSYFTQFLDISPKLKNIFEVVVAELHCRWFEFAFSNEELPKHQHSILMKYIRAFDSFTWDQDIKAKKEIESEALLKFVKFGSQSYKDARLQGIFERKYEHNVDKRRDREKTQ